MPLGSVDIFGVRNSPIQPNRRGEVPRPRGWETQPLQVGSAYIVVGMLRMP